MEDTSFSAGCAWIKDKYVPIDDAAIPITDTGFTRSDVTYDVVAVWEGKFFRLEEHLTRFEKSWKALGMNPPLSKNRMRHVLHKCVEKSGLTNAYVEMMVTRGSPAAGDRDPRNFKNQFYAFAIPYVWIAEEHEQLAGLKLVIAKSAQRISPHSVDPTVKNFHWGDLTKGLFEALALDAKTAVLLDADNNVTEGPGFNLFAFAKGRLITPATGVLLGITRQTILELADEQGVDCETGILSAKQLLGADEIFLTSTAGGVMPVSSLDGRLIGDGVPGPVTMMLRELYWQAHTRPEWTEDVAYPDESKNVSSLAR